MKEEQFAKPTDTERLDALRELCGYVENGTSGHITICQDDATKAWVLTIYPMFRSFYGDSIRHAIDLAIGRAS